MSSFENTDQLGQQPSPQAILPWPLPALLSWAVAWIVFVGLRAVDAPLFIALLCAAVIGALPAVWSPWPLSGWRRGFIALGFPLSLAASGMAGDLPAWAWLLPLGALALLYPLNAWRDAPFFPTPHGALHGLKRLVRLPESRRYSPRVRPRARSGLWPGRRPA